MPPADYQFFRQLIGSEPDRAVVFDQVVDALIESGKSLRNASHLTRRIFAALDRNHDWRITAGEVLEKLPEVV